MIELNFKYWIFRYLLIKKIIWVFLLKWEKKKKDFKPCNNQTLVRFKKFKKINERFLFIFFYKGKIKENKEVYVSKL